MATSTTSTCRNLLAILAVASITCASFSLSTPGSRRADAAPKCADPLDCRLWEAGATVGVRFGLATSNGSATHKATLLEEANVSVNHEFSWSGIEPDRGVWDFTKADDNYNFAVDHGLYQIAMHFAWDQLYLDDLPPWVTTITDPDELRSVLRTRAQTIFARYPELDRIDVINEPFLTLGSELYQNHFYDVLGPDYIEELFTIVESEAPPTTELIVNEGGIEYQPDKARSLVALVADLKAKGHRIDAVGLQTHLSIGEPNWQVLYETMQQIALLGMRPFISELDVPVPATVPDRQQIQDERYRHATLICLAVPLCDTINVWGVSDANTWYDWALYPDLDPMLFDESYQPKSSYFAVRDTLAAGRLDPSQPPQFLRTTPTGMTTGNASVTYALECRPVDQVTEIGYGELSAVTHIFVSGNPIRIPLPATLSWSTAASSDGTITYDATIELDLAEVARLYREETARPAVGLGGHLELVDTVWLWLGAQNLTLSFPAPAGTTLIGGSASSTSGSATVNGDTGSFTIGLGNLIGESRNAEPPVSVHASWAVRAGTSTAHSMVQLGPPSLSFDLEARLGVVFQGIEVYGGTTGATSCAAVQEVPVPETSIGDVYSPTSPTSASSPAAARYVSGNATPAMATPVFTG